MTIDRGGSRPGEHITKEKLVPTEIFQSAQTWTTLQTSILNEISSEFTPLRDQRVLIIGESFCIQSSQYLMAFMCISECS